MTSTKGVKVQLSTFNKWGVSGVLGFKTSLENGIDYVDFVWCKLCAANKGNVFKHSAIKGATKSAAETYINGTNVITKHTVSFILLYIRKL